MASSDQFSGFTPAGEMPVPGKSPTLGSKLIESGAQLLQSMKPLKKIQQHACSFAFYAHDMSRQIETHHYVSRLNEDFLQCAVYDSDQSDARLIGLEYIVSNRIFEELLEEEQKLWHSHAHEIKTGLWVNPGVPEMIQNPELKKLAKTYGKFWCTWQVDRGDGVPLGVPALMMSPQGVPLGTVKPDLVEKRDEKYKISTQDLQKSKVDIEELETINPHADHWKQTGKGFAIEIKEVDMITKSPSNPDYMSFFHPI